MATTTTNIQLTKPDYTDPADIAVINGNMDKVDSAISCVEDGLAIVANGNTHVAITSGQYVYVRNHSSLAEGLYKATTNISANATLSTSNLTADAKGGLNALKSDVDTLNSNIATPFTDYRIGARMRTSTITDLDTAASTNGVGTNIGVYFAKFGNSVTNNPGNSAGILIGFCYTANSEVQLALVAADSKIYVRHKASGTWGEWKTFTGA